MSDEDQPDATRHDLPDELPRSVVSDPSPLRPRSAPPLMWLILAVLVMAAFAAVLWALNPPSAHLGRASPDLVAPSAPPVRK